MAERPPLDLTDILSQYEALGGSGPPQVDYSKEWWQQKPGAIEREEESQQREQRARELEEKRFNSPQVVGYGSLIASTCMALQPSPILCWDVLGYYRALGVHWKATRKQLMTAYQDRNGPNSVLLTYIFKQLLNPKIRRAYDMTPLGKMFMDDIFVQQSIKAAAAKEAQRRSQAGRPTTAKEVIEEEFHFIPEEDEESVDAIESSGADSPVVDVPWSFAYFTWKSRKAETSVLAEWQSLIIRAVAEQGVVLNLAVGYVGKQPHRFLVGRVGTQQVAFINDQECPTEALASAAAHQLINDMHTS